MDTVKISIMQSSLFVYIYGGNRMIGYSMPLDITAEARDPDMQGLEN